MFNYNDMIRLYSMYKYQHQHDSLPMSIGEVNSSVNVRYMIRIVSYLNYDVAILEGRYKISMLYQSNGKYCLKENNFNYVSVLSWANLFLTNSNVEYKRMIV